MQLTYRGVNYPASENRTAVVASGVTGRYRGAQWVGYKAANAVAQPNHTLCWRGVRYQTNGEPVVAAAAATSAPEKPLLPQRSRDPIAETHRHAILKSLEHRLNVARSQGNQDLINLLEDEWQQFA
ncbi:DUF4278 domain-containing protein [Thermosynechococcaceae cyanobacterium Okahandja]